MKSGGDSRGPRHGKPMPGHRNREDRGAPRFGANREGGFDDRDRGGFGGKREGGFGDRPAFGGKREGGFAGGPRGDFGQDRGLGGGDCVGDRRGFHSERKPFVDRPAFGD